MHSVAGMGNPVIGIGIDLITLIDPERMGSSPTQLYLTFPKKKIRHLD